MVEWRWGSWKDTKLVITNSKGGRTKSCTWKRTHGKGLVDPLLVLWFSIPSGAFPCHTVTLFILSFPCSYCHIAGTHGIQKGKGGIQPLPCATGRGIVGKMEPSSPGKCIVKAEQLHELYQRKRWPEIRHKLCWRGLPRAVVEPPSMEIFNAWRDSAVSKLI